jgi:hypothetical protein
MCGAVQGVSGASAGPAGAGVLGGLRAGAAPSEALLGAMSTPARGLSTSGRRACLPIRLRSLAAPGFR